ncbi:hypothetical protein O181_069833, partial [Austropuccinia psidii MF-1]|nr:hypothetical protein [Austropuccinia psidii MF-1]
MSELPEKIPLIILDSSESPALFVTQHTQYMVEPPSFPSFEWDFLVIDTPKGEELILGFDFLNHFNSSIEWRQGLIIRTIMILQNLSLMTFLPPNHVQLCLIDLCGACNLLRIKAGDEHLTAFRTKYGSFEYLVMPFGLNNAPTSFQKLVNDIFQDLLDVFVVVYLDEIMVFSKSEEKHVTHVSIAITRHRANNLLAKASKSPFHVTSVEYLGYVVSSEGLKMDQEKFQQILNWPHPRNLKALQSFLGFANFYRHFIKNYAKKISSLTSFLKRDSCFPLNEEALDQFHQLKEAFTTAPILSHFNPSLPTIVETNASNYALGAVLSHISESGKHPIAFKSRKRVPEELNYEIHHKELLGIVWALKCWCK